MSPLSLGTVQVRHFIDTLSRPRAPLDPEKLARRQRRVALAKSLLPALALMLLGLVALWPEVNRTAERARRTFERFTDGTTQAMRMQAPHYRGLDRRGEPYTITARAAGEPSDGIYDLASPTADLLLQSQLRMAAHGGSGAAPAWLAVWAQGGTYRSHLAALDLAGEVTLYRNDGMIFATDAAAVDLRDIAVLSGTRVHGEGPIGTLDGQGFALLDHGSLLQVAGPVRLVLNAAHSR